MKDSPASGPSRNEVNTRRKNSRRRNIATGVATGVVCGTIAFIASGFLLTVIIMPDPCNPTEPYNPIVYCTMYIFAAVMCFLFGLGVYRWLQLPPDQRR